MSGVNSDADLINKPDYIFNASFTNQISFSTPLKDLQMLQGQFQILLKSMVNLQEYDKHEALKTKSTIRNSTHPTAIKEIDKDVHSFALLNEEILYFLLIITQDELHQLFMDFYEIFDENKTFQLQKEDLDKIISFMNQPSQLGTEKLKYLMESLIDEPSSKDKFAALNLMKVKQLPNQISEDLREKFFKQFATKAGKQNNVPTINQKKFFGVFLAFFLQFAQSRINNRKEQMNKIKGVEMVKGVIKEIKGIVSLPFVMRNTVNLDYFNPSSHNSTDVSYRSVEEALITYKNANKDIEFSTLQRILNDMEKLMKVDIQTKMEYKYVKFGKLIDYCSMRIGFHKCCSNLLKKQADQFSFQEEVILWNCCTSKKMMQKDKILKGLNKHFIQNPFHLSMSGSLDYSLGLYFSRKFPLIPKKCVDHLSLKTSKMIERKGSSISEVPQVIYEELIKEAQFKVRMYLVKIFKGLGGEFPEQLINHYLDDNPNEYTFKDENEQAAASSAKKPNQPLSKFATMGRKNEGGATQSAFFPNHFQDAITQSNVFQQPYAQSTIYQQPVAQSTISQQPVAQSTIFQLPIQLSSIQQQPASSSSLFQQPGPGTSNILQLDLNKDNSQNFSSIVAARSSARKGTLRKQNSKMDFPSSENMLSQKFKRPVDEQQNRDTLNSCFIMEGFLEKLQYMNKDKLGKFKKQNLNSDDGGEENEMYMGQQNSNVPVNLQMQGSQMRRQSQAYGALNQFGTQKQGEVQLQEIVHIQEDDYFDDILDDDFDGGRMSKRGNQQDEELLSDPIAKLMIENNQQYRNRSDFSQRFTFPGQTKENTYEDSNRNIASSKFQPDKNAPKINKQILEQVKRQQAYDKLQAIQNQEREKQQQKQNEENKNSRACDNCSIF